MLLLMAASYLNFNKGHNMFKALAKLIGHFVYNRPDKILITLMLPFLILATFNYRDNLREYKNFIFDR